MKKILSFVCALSCLSTPVWAASTIDANSSLSTQAGYSFGYLLGKSNAEAIQGLDLNAFVQGLTAASHNQNPALSEQEMANALALYKKQAEAKDLLQHQQQAQINAKAGADFLANNAHQAGVVTTASGLQYQVIKAGQGKSPSKNSTVEINYEGRLIDGTVFDSSIAREQAATFRVSEVVNGLAEGLLTMKEGGKTRFFIPAKLGYGEIGAGDAIGPNSTLIFDVELLKIK
ncbi:FKBP-type peptidyl-prolyl cis-trans isomerase [Acinetobacter sp. ANC 3791]|uniref:FKBP-type peptidyl-prolyl cis-trans isomerase n=1 Tax=Acinetobacter sp. ANC 3791 TaxID=2529836 RepID=UPI001038C0E1|nr:FKBP-type peptidyl-prolyl cis-trans isomerase [Acinetobacter sp. ANC 3791]TCB83977.1 FKBP-type peptidyl-prolyl cis-trans isomerase [Acinetobacter sp. ANC 3791]